MDTRCISFQVSESAKKYGVYLIVAFSSARGRADNLQWRMTVKLVNSKEIIKALGIQGT